MKRTALKTAIVAIISIACASCKQEMTLMTYNVGVFEKSGSNSMQHVAEIIKETQADIVSMNELDSCNLRHSTFQLEEIAQAAGGLDFHFAQAFPFAEGAYGNGIISRNPIISRHIITLPIENGAEPRSVAVVETKDCIFASAHLDHIGEAARIARTTMRRHERHPGKRHNKNSVRRMGTALRHSPDAPVTSPLRMHRLHLRPQIRKKSQSDKHPASRRQQ